VAQARQQILDLQELNEALEEKLVKSEQGRRDDMERLLKEREEKTEQIGGLKLLLKMHGIDPITGKKLSD